MAHFLPQFAPRSGGVAFHVFGIQALEPFKEVGQLGRCQ